MKEQREKHEKEKMGLYSDVAVAVTDKDMANLNIEINNSDSKGTKTSFGTSNSSPVDSQSAGDKHTTKLSKAERRRIKKERQDRELQKQIESEVANHVDYKQLEMDALAPMLAQKHMKVYDIPADGNCLFNSIIHQLKLIDYQKVT